MNKPQKRYHDARLSNNRARVLIILPLLATVLLISADDVFAAKRQDIDPFERLHRKPRETPPADTHVIPESAPVTTETTSSTIAPVAPTPQKVETKPESSVRITGRLQVDARFHKQTSFEDGSGKENQDSLIDVRRARVDVKGSLTPSIKEKMSIELVDTVRVRDAYMDYEFNDETKLRLGQFSYPFSIDNISSNRYYAMVEASLIGEALSPSRDRGVVLVGNKLDKHLYYIAGVVNGTGSKRPSANKSFDYVAHAAFLALNSDEKKFRIWINGYFASGNRDSSASDSVEFKPETESTLSLFSVDLPEKIPFTRQRSGASAQLLFGSLYVGAEYLKTEYTFDEKIIFDGGMVQAGYFLTGEQRNIEDGMLERQPVKSPFGTNDGFGAVEIVARYSWYNADPILFENASITTEWEALDASKNSLKGKAISVGLNWYPTKMTRVMIDYVKTNADAADPDTGALGAEEAIVARAQIEF